MEANEERSEEYIDFTRTEPRADSFNDWFQTPSISMDDIWDERLL